MVLPYFSDMRWDAILHNWDLVLLGVNPTLWFEQYTNPIFTEILYIAYFLYFPMPLVVFGWMIYKRQYTAIEKYLFIFLVTYYISYILYFFVPAIGPRFFLASQYTIPLKGIWVSESIRNFIDTMEPNKLDAFPSLHTAILFTTLILAYKNNKTLFYIYIPIGILILISVIYCRYHYFVDVLAGIIVSFASYGIAYKFYYKYSGKFYFHFGDKTV
jgi:membrane-associated phospholipid phosphatase